MSVETINHESLGQCMYCGSVDPPLTDEHVVPRGLNGGWVFPASSCSACQVMIGRIETPILKSGWLSDPRLVMGLRSYKPRRQSTHIRMMFVGGNGKRFVKDVPKDKAIASILMPELIVPRYLGSSLPLDAKEGMDVFALNNALVYRGMLEGDGKKYSEKIDKAARQLCMAYQANSIQFLSSIRPPQIIGFLCKIAHGFHVWERGMFPLEESPAIAILRGERTDYSNWVGSMPSSSDKEQQSESLHKMLIEDVTTESGKQCTLVRLSLFNSFGPQFSYVVITRAPGWQNFIR